MYIRHIQEVMLIRPSDIFGIIPLRDRNAASVY